MLSTVALIAALTAPFVAAGPGPGPGQYSWFSNVPAQGFESVKDSFYIYPNATQITGYYAASSWWFKGHDQQYFGVQPFTPGFRSTTGHVAYSVFGKGSSIGDPERCSVGADGGDGVSCSLDIDIDFGRWYTIESKVVEKKADGSRRWNGTLFDDTGRATYIASFWTDATYQALGNSGQWLEWYKYNLDGKTPEQRECTPYFPVAYGVSEAEGQKASSTRVWRDRIDDKCAVEAGHGNWRQWWDSEGRMTIEAGIYTPH